MDVSGIVTFFKKKWRHIMTAPYILETAILLELVSMGMLVISFALVYASQDALLGMIGEVTFMLSSLGMIFALVVIFARILSYRRV